MTLAILGLPLVSFAISWTLTLFIRRVAPRLGWLDNPGGRKIHAAPKPLGGGTAIFLGIALPLVGGLAYLHLQPAVAHDYLLNLGAGARSGVAVLAALVAMHALGLRDDKKALGPVIKLVVQLAIIGTLVIAMDLRVLTLLDGLLGMGRWPSVVVTILWITAVTNAFNFLDNMDGLSAGVAAVCTVAFLATALSINQWFVAAMLALLLGSLLGFLCFNFPPASIFMGDGGSLVIGLLLGILTVRTTYLERSAQPLAGNWYKLLAPVVVLALPLYDLVVVTGIRLMRGKSPFVGDTNHFSHRLVARGMSRSTAVLCLYLVTAATSVAAVLLPQVSGTGAVLIFLQTVLVLGVVALLEQHPLPPGRDDRDS